jgi:protein-S-isoprenylcysteine O-methyltransferase Ste14
VGSGIVDNAGWLLLHREIHPEETSKRGRQVFSLIVFANKRSVPGKPLRTGHQSFLMPTEKPSQKGNSYLLMYIYSPLMVLPLILVFIFYNFLGLSVLVYAGWLVIATGVIIVFAAGHEFRVKGGVPEGKHLVHTTHFVDSGIYAVIRHPQYLGFILIVLGPVLMSQHWLSIICGVVGSVLFYIDVQNEERSSIEKFGDEYRQYMQKVPRMNLLIGVIRLLRRKER